MKYRHQSKESIMRTVEFKTTTNLPGHAPFQAGDRKAFDDDLAQFIIDAGWGSDAKTGEQHEPKPGPVQIAIDPLLNHGA